MGDKEEEAFQIVKEAVYNACALDSDEGMSIDKCHWFNFSSNVVSAKTRW